MKQQAIFPHKLKNYTCEEKTRYMVIKSPSGAISSHLEIPDLKEVSKRVVEKLMDIQNTQNIY